LPGLNGGGAAATVPPSVTRVVIEDRSVTPVWPRMVDLLHRSAGGVSLLTLRSWSIHQLFGPGWRFRLCSGGWPRVRSTRHRSAWCAGISSESLAMWPKTEFRRRFTRSDIDAVLCVRCLLSFVIIWKCRTF